MTSWFKLERKGLPISLKILFYNWSDNLPETSPTYWKKRQHNKRNYKHNSSNTLQPSNYKGNQMIMKKIYPHSIRQINNFNFSLLKTRNKKLLGKTNSLVNVLVSILHSFLYKNISRNSKIFCWMIKKLNSRWLEI